MDVILNIFHIVASFLSELQIAKIVKESGNATSLYADIF